MKLIFFVPKPFCHSRLIGQRFLMNQQPIFILGSHKSGTSLLRNLFNGHSQLYTIPFETHFFQFADYWVDYEYRKQSPRKLSKQQYIESFCSYIKERNSVEDNLGGGSAKGRLNVDDFKANFSGIDIDWSDKKKFEKYIESIYFAEKGYVLDEQLRVLEKSVINPEFAGLLAQFFPEAHFIHILRNPYSNMVSFRKFKSVAGKFPALHRILKSLRNSYYYLYKNRRMLENYTVIRYEDLILTPEIELQKLCKKVNLPFEDTLLSPTTNGENWEGNSTTGAKFSGVDTRNLDHWKSEISHIEIEYINQFFPFIVSDFNYEKMESSSNHFAPIHSESAKVYAANRAVKYLF